jgi:Rrf2 family nitric oxide-sensitive transcriptional repressor
MRLAGEPDRLFTTDEVAAEFRISRHHLAKVIRPLAEAGVIVTQRGVGGGFRLARPPQNVRLGEIVRLLELGQPLVECFRDDGGRCTLTPGCKLRRRLVAARDAFIAELDRSTLADCAYLPSAGLD